MFTNKELAQFCITNNTNRRDIERQEKASLINKSRRKVK